MMKKLLATLVILTFILQSGSIKVQAANIKEQGAVEAEYNGYDKITLTTKEKGKIVYAWTYLEGEMDLAGEITGETWEVWSSFIDMTNGDITYFSDNKNTWLEYKEPIEAEITSSFEHINLYVALKRPDGSFTESQHFSYMYNDDAPRITYSVKYNEDKSVATISFTAKSDVIGITSIEINGGTKNRYKTLKNVNGDTKASMTIEVRENDFYALGATNINSIHTTEYVRIEDIDTSKVDYSAIEFKIVGVSLKKAKKIGLKKLETAFKKYKNSNYYASDYKKISDYYEAGITKLKSAKNNGEIISCLNNYSRNMAGVKDKKTVLINYKNKTVKKLSNSYNNLIEKNEYSIEALESLEKIYNSYIIKIENAGSKTKANNYRKNCIDKMNTILPMV